MSHSEFASHRASHQSVNWALADVRSRIDRLDVPSLEAQLGFRLAEVMAFYEEELAHRFPLSFADARQFLNKLAEQLPLSEVGTFLLCARGCDWRTTDYFFDEAYRLTLRGRLQDGTLPLFDYLLFFVSPGWSATHERFGIFQAQTQLHTRDEACLASLPCGRMRDLLTLDYTHIRRTIRLVGLDKDPAAVAGARDLAQEVLKENGRIKTEWHIGDALRPGLTEPALAKEFDLVTSNGLNIYLTDEQCVVFYANVFTALKPGGVFITSHLVPPAQYHWDRVNKHHWQLQALVWKTLINPLWESFLKPTETVQAQLQRAGFVEVQILPDSQGIFPTFIGKVP